MFTMAQYSGMGTYEEEAKNADCAGEESELSQSSAMSTCYPKCGYQVKSSSRAKFFISCLPTRQSTGVLSAFTAYIQAVHEGVNSSTIDVNVKDVLVTSLRLLERYTALCRWRHICQRCQTGFAGEVALSELNESTMDA